MAWVPQLRDKDDQSAMKQDIAGRLKARNFGGSPNPLSNIEAGGPRLIFPQLVYGISNNVPLHNGNLNALRALKYFHVSSLGHKRLAATASIYPWPYLPGPLYWFVELGKGELELINSLTLLTFDSSGLTRNV